MKNIIKLTAVALYLESALQALGFNVNYRVESVYDDLGLDSTHDTVVASDVDGENEFQIFTPNQIKDVLDDKFTPIQADEMIEKHVKLFDKLNVPRLS